MVNNTCKKILVTLLCLCLVTITLVSCAQGNTQGDANSDALVIRINHTMSFGASIIQLLMLTGMLEDLLPDDVSVEWVNINNSANIRDALVTDRIDIATKNLPSFLTAIHNDMPILLMSNYITQTGLIFSNNPDIASLDDITPAHRLASTGIGTAYHLALMMIALENFDDATRFDNNLTVMDNAAMITSVENSRDLDMIMLGFPSIIRAHEIESVFPIFDLTSTLNDYNISFVTVANEDFYNNNPDLVEILYQAYAKMIDFIINHPHEAAELLAKFYGNVSAEDITQQLMRSPPQLEISESGFNRVTELMSEVGMIPGTPKKLSDLPNFNSIPRVP